MSAVAMVPAVAIALVCSVLLGVSTPGEAGSPGLPMSDGAPAVPPRWAQAEVLATSSCPGLSWSVLGALGWLASRSGRLAPGAPPPWWTWDGGAFGVVPEDGARHRSVVVQARRAMSRLCVAEMASGSLLAGLGGLLGSGSAALEVIVLAVALRDQPALLSSDAVAISFAVHALGTPYAWGGNGPDTYDCSGLMVAAERAAGRVIPRTAQEQHEATTRASPPGAPGDLAFFGSGPRDIGHVGLIIGGGLMIDAPYTGAVVRIESYAWQELVDEGTVAR